MNSNYPKWLAFASIAIGLFTSVVDYSSLTLALPSISNYFQTDLRNVQLIIIAYGVTIAALLIPMGKLSDLLGKKKIYITGLILFVIGGFIAALSSNLNQLIVAKTLQGIGSAMSQSTSMAIVISTFPEKERGKILGIQLSIVGLGGVIGPVIAGILIGIWGWQSIFWLTTLLATFAVFSAIKFINPTNISLNQENVKRFDWLGSILSIFILTSLIIFLTSIANNNGISIITTIEILFFISCLIIFIIWESKYKHPLLDLNLFKINIFAIGILSGYICFLGMSSLRFLLPFYLQIVLEYKPSTIGLIFVPSALCMAIAGPISGRLSDKFGYRYFTSGGLLISSIGLFILSNLSLNSSLYLIIPAMIIQTIGIGVFQPANNSSVLSVIKSQNYGVISGFLNLIRITGNVSSVAISTIIVTSTMAIMGYAPNLSALNTESGIEILKSFTSGVNITYKIFAIIVLITAFGCFIKGNNKNSKINKELF